MEIGRELFVRFWRVPPVEVLLTVSLLAHAGLALWRLWQRRSLRLPLTEIVQHATGLLIPLWLTVHVLGTGVLHRLAGTRDSYAFELDLIWPGGMWLMTVLLLLVWAHGCLGLHRWLRLRRWYRRLQGPALAIALLLPTLALLGTVAGGREYAQRKAADPAWAAAVARAERWPTSEMRDRFIYAPEHRTVAVFEWLVIGLFAARGLRWLVERRRHVRLTYPGGRVVSVPRGMSVLEASRARGIPHASVCGGRGRCSTCRVRVGKGRERLPAPSPEEARVLGRLGAPADVRLACQIRPVADLAVMPLLPADAGLAAVGRGDPSLGAERELTVMFADLRGFTRFAEGRLPYDVVFVLNRYFRAMGMEIEAAGGRVDKLIGDGIMAWFGLDREPGEGARAALAAARGMGLALARLNGELAAELAQPLRMGIGLHRGPVIVGEMGYGGTAALTAIGDTVNVASRLESASKEFAAELVLSEEVRRAAGVELTTAERHALTVRGRKGELTVWILPRAAALELPRDAASRPSLLQRLRTRALARSSATV